MPGEEDIAFRVLAANNTPDFRTVSDFRKDHLEALGELFLQVLALCQRAGLVKLGHVALDGTKVRANASRHKAMSYGRMKEKETQLAAEVAELLRQAEEVDGEEDRRYGRDKRGDELPEELAFREGRLRKIREAKAALEAAGTGGSRGKDSSGSAGDKTQRNFTDPDSRIMPGPGGRDFQQSYNCQAVVDSAHQVIVAARATNQASWWRRPSAMPAQCPRRYPPTRGTTRRGRWRNSRPWGSTRSSHRRGPATARGRSLHPGAAYPKGCLPGTG